jgi:hypothetical protein
MKMFPSFKDLRTLDVKFGLTDSCLSNKNFLIKVSDVGKNNEELMFAKHCHDKCKVYKKEHEPTEVWTWRPIKLPNKLFISCCAVSVGLR